MPSCLCDQDYMSKLPFPHPNLSPSLHMKFQLIGPVVSEDMFKIVDRQTPVFGILLAHTDQKFCLKAFQNWGNTLWLTPCQLDSWRCESVDL